MKYKKVPEFRYSHTFLIIVNEESISIKGNLAELIGKKDAISISSSKSFPFISNLNIINYAVIYTDIINDQFIGDTLAPVLYILNLKTSETGEIVTKFDNPHYIPVKKSILNTINIRLADISGESIKFSDIFSIVILKLHFRKIKHE